MQRQGKNDVQAIPQYKLLTGDALLQLRFIKSESIDCVFTSPEPPINHNEMRALITIMLELPRILKPTGSIWVNMSDYHNADGVLSIIPERFVHTMVVVYDWQLMNTIIWDRPAPFDTSNPGRRFRRTHEYLYWFVKDVDNYYFNQLAPHRYGTIITSAYKPPEPGVFESGFPTDLIARTALYTCPIDGRILDPFCGTGTTGVVALQHGREFLGIEIDERRINKIRARLDKSCLTIR